MKKSVFVAAVALFVAALGVVIALAAYFKNKNTYLYEDDDLLFDDDDDLEYYPSDYPEEDDLSPESNENPDGSISF